MKLKFPFRKLKAVCTTDQVYDKKTNKTLDNLMGGNSESSSEESKSLLTINGMSSTSIAENMLINSTNEKLGLLNGWLSILLGMMPPSSSNMSFDIMAMCAFYGISISYNITPISETKVEIEYTSMGVKVNFDIEIITENDTKRVIIPDFNDWSVVPNISVDVLESALAPVMGLVNLLDKDNAVDYIEPLIQRSWQYLR